MVLRLTAVVRACAGALVLVLSTACGGGGSAPPDTSTPAPGTLNVPGRQSSGGGSGGFVNDGLNLSSYSITSYPAGRSFTLEGQTYATPALLSPATSNSPLAIVFGSYTVPIDQVKDGPHRVFYNAASDSTGLVVTSSLRSIARRTAAVIPPVLAGVVRRPLGSRLARSDVDPLRVAVRMSSAALRTSGRTPADVERAAGSTGYETLSATADRLRVVSVPRGQSVAAFTRRLLALPEVAAVSPVHVRHTLTRPPTSVTDPDFNIPGQWYTFATGANYAWSYNPGIGARLAIVDTGVDANNTDLSAQLAYEETAVTPLDDTPTAANANAPTCNPIGTTVVTPNVAQDDDGHGTNVAGIALAKADTAGFAGTAWGAKLIAIKIFPSQNQYCNNDLFNIGADTADEARGVSDALAQGADVISLSLGSSSFDVVEFNALESAIAAGVTVVAAAGNGQDGSQPGTLDYPAAYPGVISVGASALRDEYYGQPQPRTDGTYATATEIVASYSQYAPSLSVVAPGGEASATSEVAYDADILHWIWNYSTTTAYLPADRCSDPLPATNCTALFNGTSMATPQVAATAAMLIAAAGGHHSLNPAQVEYAIESSADNINDPKQGHGRLNAYRALASLLRDSSAYSGPVAQRTGTAQLVAFAYATGKTNKPAIVDASFPAGVPVAPDGSFRIADVPLSVGSFRVAVWYDGNADGVIDAGDQIGVAAAVCSAASPCPIGSIALHPVPAGYSLP